MSTVFWIAAQAAEPPALLRRKLEALWQAAELARVFTRNDLAALKLHVGEPGTTTFIRPPLVAELVRLVGESGAQPFLTDTAVLYKSRRDNGVGHARVAHEHGFTFEAVGAPFLPADGLHGADELEVELVGGKHFREVAIAAAILQARSMLVLSHATGHLGTGFGAALKNLGMGCSSKKAKLRQHHGHQPRVEASACTACGTCVEWCPSDAITIDTAARIDPAICIGCGECIAVCRDGAIEFGWGIMGAELQERIVEHAAAVVLSKPERIAYVTVAQQMTKDCDCMGLAQQPLLEDIGFLAATDPVAIDAAVLGMVAERAGRSFESLAYPKRDASRQLVYAEELGLGERRVELVEVRLDAEG